MKGDRVKGTRAVRRVAPAAEFDAHLKKLGLAFQKYENIRMPELTEELIDEVDEIAGVAAFAELASKSNNTLFI